MTPFPDEPEKAARFYATFGYDAQQIANTVIASFPGTPPDEALWMARRAIAGHQAEDRAADLAIADEAKAAVAAEHDLTISMHPPEAP